MQVLFPGAQWDFTSHRHLLVGTLSRCQLLQPPSASAAMRTLKSTNLSGISVTGHTKILRIVVQPSYCSMSTAHSTVFYLFRCVGQSVVYSIPSYRNTHAAVTYLHMCVGQCAVCSQCYRNAHHGHLPVHVCLSVCSLYPVLQKHTARPAELSVQPQSQDRFSSSAHGSDTGMEHT